MALDGGTVGMSAILFACVAFFSTCLGGVFALRFRAHLSLLLGFTAGTLIGLAVFQWLPRLFDALAAQPGERLPALTAIIVGFLLYHVLDKVSGLLHQRPPHASVQGDPLLGGISVLLFALHRVFEGVSIGASFQLSTTTGILVGCAVIIHDLVEGWNAVAVLLANHNSRKQAFGLLLLFASAPVLGALTTLWIALPAQLLPRYLGFFVGLFLCIGASHLLPEAHRERSSLLTIGCTIAGVLLAFAITAGPMLIQTLFL